MEDRFVETADGQIHYRQDGRGDPLILLHSLGTSTAAYADVMPVLATRFAVYALDIPGHGDSTKPPRDYAIPDYADSVVRFMSALELTTAAVIGNSISAVISLNLASRYPQRVKGLVLVGCPVWSTPQEKSERLEFFRQQLDEKGMPRARTLDELALTYEHPTAQLLETVNADRARAGEWLAKAFYALVAYDTPSSLPGIICPTSLVYGRKDLLMEKAGLLLLGIAGSQAYVIERAGHLPQVDQPEAFAQTVLRLLARG